MTVGMLIVGANFDAVYKIHWIVATLQKASAYIMLPKAALKQNPYNSTPEVDGVEFCCCGIYVDDLQLDSLGSRFTVYNAV